MIKWSHFDQTNLNFNQFYEAQGRKLIICYATLTFNSYEELLLKT
jgi:hypothetical protein